MFAFGATMLEMTSSRPLPLSGGVHSAEWHRLRVRDNKRAARGAAWVLPTVGTQRAHLQNRPSGIGLV